MQNALGRQTFKIDVHLTFKGRLGLRYQHVFAFDQEEADKMMADDAAGSIKTALNLINKDVNEALAASLGTDPLDFDTLERANQVLQEVLGSINKGQDNDLSGMNIIRACSEALYYGVVSCFSSGIPAH